MEPEHPVLISDLPFAAFAHAKGVRLIGVAGPPGRREFCFQGPLPRDLLPSFYNGENDLVSAKALLHSLKILRGLLAQTLDYPPPRDGARRPRSLRQRPGQ